MKTLTIEHFHSSTYQELLDEEPGKILRTGMYVILGVVVMAIVAGWYIQTPDVVSSTITVTTRHPPLPIVANTTGRLTLYRHDGDMIKQDDLIAVIDHAGNIEALLSLAAILPQAAVTEPLDVPTLSEHFRRVPLGPIERSFTEYLQAYEKYKRLQLSTYARDAVNNLSQKIETSQRLKTVARERLALQEQKLRLIQEAHHSKQRLLEKGLLSAADLSTSQQNMLEHMQEVNRVKAELENIDILRATHQADILKVTQDAEEQSKHQRAAVLAAFKNLRQDVQEWENKYLIRAPSPGKLTLFDVWTDKQLAVVPGTIGMVVPVGDAGTFRGQMLIRDAGLGKITPGSKVIVELDAYPYRQYGRLIAEVQQIAPIAQEKGYTILVQFLHGLSTTYGKELPFIPQMQGKARIITRESRFLQRVFDVFRTIND